MKDHYVKNRFEISGPSWGSSDTNIFGFYELTEATLAYFIHNNFRADSTTSTKLQTFGTNFRVRTNKGSARKLVGIK